MSNRQLQLLKAFLASIDDDVATQEQLKAYGNAYEHLLDFFADENLWQRKLSEITKIAVPF